MNLNKKGKVRVTAHPETGNVVTESSKPGFGFIRLEQDRQSMEGGFLNSSTQSALIGGQLDQLNALGLTEGQELPGHIVFEESTVPFYEGQQPKINPQTEETLMKDGKPIYRQTFWTQDMTRQDKPISHDRVPVSSSEGQEKEEAVVAEGSITG